MGSASRDRGARYGIYIGNVERWSDGIAGAARNQYRDTGRCGSGYFRVDGCSGDVKFVLDSDSPGKRFNHGARWLQREGFYPRRRDNDDSVSGRYVSDAELGVLI